MSIIQMIQMNLEAEEQSLANINKIYKEISRKHIPKGNLICRDHGEYRDYYFRARGGSSLKYLKKKSADDSRLIESLKREYLLRQYRTILEENISLQKQFISAYIPSDFDLINATMPKAYQYYPEDCPIFKPEWQIRPSQNPYYTEYLRHKTKFGLWVRSKSELIIAELLFDMGVGFWYEKELVLRDEKGKTRASYPDFTITCRHGKEIYWEHKGMMDDEEYFLRDQDKMQIYQLNGIYPPKNLIITHDGPDGSLAMQDLRLLVNGLVLPRL